MECVIFFTKVLRSCHITKSTFFKVTNKYSALLVALLL